MLISLNWIREYCPFVTDESPQRIGERFSLATAEVEGVARRGEGLDQFVAARVEDVAPVAPGTDGAGSLWRVRIAFGRGREATVLCGAPNVRAGMLAPYAAPGTTVRGQAIAERTIRGVVSQGMLLSEAELGISERHEGILELPAGTAPGTLVGDALPAVADTILEVDNKSLTHRPDLWGHYGIAREFATIYRAPLEPYPVDEALALSAGEAGVAIAIEPGDARQRCRRYCGLRIDGVRVAPSPDWLAQRLLAVGSRPINNLVDITNYVLLELGQPLHAFDTTRLRGGRITVRMAAAGERMTLLDGREVRLDPQDLLITDGVGPVALAGVMGGDGSQIREDTVSVFLESANFDPTSVRRSSIRHGRTDSSARFEKSLDPFQARLGILRAARLIVDLCPGAKVVGPLQDVGFAPSAPICITVSPRWIARRLGAEVPAADMADILARLGFSVKEENGGAAATTWQVAVPSWRATRDVSIPADLVEEIGRIHGFDSIVPVAPLWPVTPPRRNEQRTFERRAKACLSGAGGLSEVYTYSMVGEKHCVRFGLAPEHHLRIENPLSEEQDRLRRELVPALLEKAAANQRFFDRFGMYEIGRVYLKDPQRLGDPGLPLENTRIAGVLAWPEKRPANFYAASRLLLALVDWLELEPLELDAPPARLPAWAHPEVAAGLRVADRHVGLLYRLHPDFQHALELRSDVLAFDLDFDALFDCPRREIRWRPLPRFPDVPFDVSVVVPERTEARELERLVREAAGGLLRRVTVFDVYQGKGVPAGKKSLSLHLVFRSDERTLAARDVEALERGVVERLARAGYPLR